MDESIRKPHCVLCGGRIRKQRVDSASWRITLIYLVACGCPAIGVRAIGYLSAATSNLERVVDWLLILAAVAMFCAGLVIDKVFGSRKEKLVCENCGASFDVA